MRLHLDDLDDERLMALHVDGDVDAFGVLVARHRDRAWAVALRTLGDPTEAADAVQDAFLSAYRSAATFRSEARFTTWLHRIVVNACLDRVRRTKARPTVTLDETAAAAVADPHDAIAASDVAADVAAALRLISEDQRLAILLVDVQGLPVDEAAEVLGVPAGTVKSRCHRGRIALAVHLGHLRPERARGTAAGGAASDRGPSPTPSTPSEP